ncbi:MAG: glycoside hydrolase family 38 C-terminal domain-containing protein [Acidobacteriota bacterium]|nr:glycoside hydrolase family 38 C-terminal domain-containing protein [Acidobacteriota bacterium]
MLRRRVLLLCNAHLDPVWLWEWPEGAGEAVATFRVAAEFCETRPGFVFCHNEAVLYQWVEEYEPELFARIKRLVKAGRWSILGGWFLQPDANLPSGESFVRQALLGKRYFRDRFGVDVPVAANLDPFGHTRGLVQILAKSGTRGYLFCRPDRAFAALPGEDFVWVGYDGSQVLATRVEAHYNSKGGGAREKIETWLAEHPGRPTSLLLWGIGNHGGGASARDLDDIEALKREKAGRIEIVHASADAYFAGLERRRKSLPRHAAGLNPWAVGCYTTMARIKQAHRRLENEFFSAEKMASAAAFQGLLPYPRTEMAEALRDLALSEFHDILPGSSIPPAEEGALRLLGHGLEIVSRVKARAFFALAAGEPKAGPGEIPIFVYNPHPWRLRTLVSCEFQDHEPNYGDGWMRPVLRRGGKPVACQAEKELSNLQLEWRKRIIFAADLQPSGLTRFDVRLDKTKSRPVPALAASNGAIRFRTRSLDVAVDVRTGLARRFRVGGIDILRPGAFEPLVIADNADPWGMRVVRFREVAGKFRAADPAACARAAGVGAERLAPVRVIEDGEVRTVVESILAYGSSFVILRFKLPKSGTETEVEVRVLWNEKDRMLKLRLPTTLRDGVYWGQVAYGRDRLPANGDEAVAQKWTAVVSPSRRIALTCVNEATYGSDCKDGEMRLSLLRSPAHAADPALGAPLLYQDRFIPRIDQGERVFRFWIDAGPAAALLRGIDRKALAGNEEPYVLPWFPPGKGRRPQTFARLDDGPGGAVLITALKPAENDGRLVIRLFEPTGTKRETTLRLPFAGAETRLVMKPFEIKTLLFDPRDSGFTECDLLEDPLGGK